MSVTAAIVATQRKGTVARTARRSLVSAEGDSCLSFDLLLGPAEVRTIALPLDPVRLELLWIDANDRAGLARGEPASGEVKQLVINDYEPGFGTIDIDFGGSIGAAGTIYNDASAAAVRAAIEAAPGVGPGNVACTGGPLGVAPVTITFAGGLGDIPAGSVVQLLPAPALAVLSTISDGGGGGAGLDDEATIEPTWPLCWWPAAPWPCPFTAAAEQLTFTNLSSTRRTRIRFRAILGA
jgi:hypothetical protein